MTYEPFTEVTKRTKVLVVDDNRMNLVLAKRLMEQFGVEVDIASDGAEALEQMKETEYAMVFMDHYMPEMDGVETTQEIRKLEPEYCKSVPVAVLTANTEMENCGVLESTGFCAYLAKPLQADELGVVLQRFVGIETQGNRTVATGTDAPEIKGIHAAEVMRRNGFDRATYLSLLRTWYEDLPVVMKRALTAKMAGDIKRFVIEVHSLKSSGAGVGAEELSELARRLETAGKEEDTEYIEDHMVEFISLCKQTEKRLEAIFSVEEEIEAGEEVVTREWLEAMAEACDDMDISKALELLGEQRGKHFSEREKGLLEKIRSYVEHYDYDEAACLAQKEAEERRER